MTEINPLTARVKPHVEGLISAAAAGDRDASQVIVWYRNYCRCPENGALVICEQNLKAWLAKQPNAKHPPS